MRIINTDPRTTVFTLIGSAFQGFGVTLALNLADDTLMEPSVPLRLQNFPIRFARLVFTMPQLSPSILQFSEFSDMDGIFENLLPPPSISNAGPSNVTQTHVDGEFVVVPEIVVKNKADLVNEVIQTLVNREVKVSLCVSFPETWKADDGSVSGRSTLKGYANLAVSALLWFRARGLAIAYLETPLHPDDVWIPPQELVVLASDLKVLTALRKVTPPVKIVGPGKSQLLESGDAFDGYTQAFTNSRNALDCWSLHIKEHLAEHAWGSESCRYIKAQITRSMAQLAAVNFSLPKLALTVAPRTDTDDDRETLKFALKTLEYVMATVERGVTLCSLPPLSIFFRSTGERTVAGDLMTHLAREIPTPTNVYFGHEVNSHNEDAGKLFVTSSNGSRFLLSLVRPKAKDVAAGKLIVVVQNPLWNHTYKATDFTWTAFPATTDISKIEPVKATFLTGKLRLELSALPYGDIALTLTGNVEIAPTPPAAPIAVPPTGSPSTGGEPSRGLLQTIVQVPVLYGTPETPVQQQGTIYYDTKDKMMKVYVDGDFIRASFLTKS